MSVIVGFTDEYFFLSNFYPHPVDFEGETYPTNEHAFQAAKTYDLYQRGWIGSAPTPGEAKRRGRASELRPYWNECIRYGVMEELLHKKFSREPGAYNPLVDWLYQTGSAILLEGNDWGDMTWGCIKRSSPDMPGQHWQGHNLLGWMLMKVRSEL